MDSLHLQTSHTRGPSPEINDTNHASDLYTTVLDVCKDNGRRQPYIDLVADSEFGMLFWANMLYGASEYSLSYLNFIPTHGMSSIIAFKQASIENVNNELAANFLEWFANNVMWHTTQTMPI